MREQAHPEPTHQPNEEQSAQPAISQSHLPSRMMTAFEVAEFVGCHEESVRRAYLCGQLRRRRFGVRSWRFLPADVQDWIARGAPTRIL
jgi:predicted DNA-binding transcriptional regulator AlpA